jgi:hypothetical protein
MRDIGDRDHYVMYGLCNNGDELKETGMSTVAASQIPIKAAVHGDPFYVGMAGVFVAVAILGFAPTYWVPMVRGTLSVPPITHVHALFFYGWTLFFLWQTWLVRAGRVTRHREMGVAGVALATGMVFVGLNATVTSLNLSEAAGFGGAARPFAIVSVSAIALFATLVAIAIAKVKRPEVHKRLMLVATASILQAAVGRWFLLFLAPGGGAGPVSPPPVFVTVLPGLVVDLLIVAAMVHDRRTRGHVHQVYWIAGAAVVAVQVLRVPASATSGWAHVVSWLVAMFP